MSSGSPSVVMPPASQSVVRSAAQVAVQAATQHTYAAGLTVPEVCQQPCMAMPAVTCQRSQPMSPEQLSAFFRMKDPNACQPYAAA
eukprot:7143972-Lingulodinium_polyedra.AAC.1